MLPVDFTPWQNSQEEKISSLRLNGFWTWRWQNLVRHVRLVNRFSRVAMQSLKSQARLEVKIIYRSHIEVRKDQVEWVGSPKAHVWRLIWDSVNEADTFLSHPVDKFVLNLVPLEIIGLIPACTDQKYEIYNCIAIFVIYAMSRKRTTLSTRQESTSRKSRDLTRTKCITDIIGSCHQLCDRIIRDAPEMLLPQLLIHGAIDDPDAELPFAETQQLLQSSSYAAISNDVLVVRIMLTATITTSMVVLQVSLCGRFQVKVCEALCRRRPVVATRAGGIPCKLNTENLGCFVDIGDTESVANHLFDLYTNHDLYASMSTHADASMCDKVGTVGNAGCSFHLTSKLVRGQKS
ncbi:hypothetical protein HOY82DRAFT_634138 [Tuber indicum]|nr:hypothetical protein HOY82DRAFT_634138 [Tuber indicum]